MWNSSYNRYSWEDALAHNLIGVCILLVIVAAIVLVWLIVRAGALLVRVLARHHANRAVQLALATCAILVLLVTITAGRQGAIDLLAALSGGAILLVCKVVELVNDERLGRKPGVNTTIHSALHEPWWDAA